MPAAVLACPHCEKPVELQVTAVTRSRPCPHCSKPIMLQFTQKEGRVKRKALLLTEMGGLDFEALKNEVPVEEPMPLPGDAFERMKADPELIAIKKRFALSVLIVAALVILAMILNWNQAKLFPAPPKKVSVPAISDSSPEVITNAVRDTRMATAMRPTAKPQALDFTQVKAQENERPSLRPINPTNPSRVIPGSAATNPVPGYSGGIPTPSRLSVPGKTAAGKAVSPLQAVPESLLRVARARAVTLVPHDLNKAKSALVGFLKAAGSSERLQYVRERSLVEPRLRAYEARFGQAAYPFEKITDSMVVGTGVASEHDVMMSDQMVHRASVLKSDDGAYLVDWPSFVGEGDLHWEEVTEKKPGLPVLLRVTAERGDFFGGEFADASWLLCVKLSHPVRTGLPPIYAYVEKKSVLGREVDYWLREGGGQVVPMTVRVKYPSVNATSDQVTLTELVSPGWLLSGGQAVVEARGTAPVN
jgi:hypothetical protein